MNSLVTAINTLWNFWNKGRVILIDVPPMLQLQLVENTMYLMWMESPPVFNQMLQFKRDCLPVSLSTILTQ